MTRKAAKKQLRQLTDGEIGEVIARLGAGETFAKIGRDFATTGGRIRSLVGKWIERNKLISIFEHKQKIRDMQAVIRAMPKSPWPEHLHHCPYGGCLVPPMSYCGREGCPRHDIDSIHKVVTPVPWPQPVVD